VCENPTEETADLSTTLRFGQDDKCVATLVAFFIRFSSSWVGRKAHDNSGRDDKFVKQLAAILGKNGRCFATNLLSRPVQSVVERSAVFFA
jgi:hypothetical protein